MDADAVLDHHRLAVRAGHPAVEILDRAKAVAAELQRVGELAEPVFADVEDVLAGVRRMRRAIGHRHLGDRGAVADRTPGVGDVVQRQPLAGVEADHHRPVVPVDPPPRHREGDAVRLGDVDRLEVVARGLVRVGRVVAVRLRHRDDAVIVDAQDLHLLDVDDCVDAFDRVGVEVVFGMRADPGEGVADMLARLLRPAIAAGRPWVDADQLQIGDAALGAGGDEVGVLLHLGLDREELLGHDHRPRRRMLGLADDLALGERYPVAENPDLAGAEDVDAGCARDLVAGGEGADRLLRRLQKLDHLEPDGAVLLAHVLANQRGGEGDLGGGERLQRVKDSLRRIGSDAISCAELVHVAPPFSRFAPHQKTLRQAPMGVKRTVYSG